MNYWLPALIIGSSIFLSISVIGAMVCYFLRLYLFVNKYKSLVEIQEHYCAIAYEFIYKDQILAFSASGFNINGEELESVKRNFIKMTMELMGSNHVDLLSSFYGTEDALTHNLIIWFSRKMDTDEIIDFVEKQKNVIQEQNSELDENVMGKKPQER